MELFPSREISAINYLQQKGGEDGIREEFIKYMV
jgi:hypothetical protein